MKQGARYKPYETYLSSVSRAQSIKIWELMRTKSLSFVDAVCHFLTQCKASQKVIDGFSERPMIDTEAWYDQMKIYDMKAFGRETKTERKKVAPKTLTFIKEPQPKPLPPADPAPVLPPFKFTAGVDSDSDVAVVKQVNDIINSKALFSDPEFPACDDSIGSGNYGRIEWKRLGQLYASPRLFNTNEQKMFRDNGSVRPGAIKSGGLLVPLNKLEKPEVLFYNKDVNKSGIYMVYFYLNGVRRCVVVDDQIPCLNGKPAFAHSESDDAWCLLVEKAWAKLHGSYHRTAKAQPHFVWTHLTGIPAHYYNHDQPDDHSRLKFMIGDGLQRQLTIFASKDPDCEVAAMHDV